MKPCRLFQSHLYGIESAVSWQRSTCHWVSIAPLWNWKMLAKIMRASKPECFNRTFMELKDKRKQAAIARWRFQSHLYGIESRSSMPMTCKGMPFQSHLYGIERCGRAICTPPFFSFQSHLYGIERGWRQGKPRWRVVSIAPLWNWKLVYI